MIKQVCILTKSYKDNGYCVAGIDIENGQWIRLVSTEESDDKIPKYYMDKSYNFIDVLDVVEVDLIKHIPKKCQTENYLIDLKIPLKKVDKLSFNEVVDIKGYDEVFTIFGNRGKAITPNDAEKLTYSLLLVPIKDLTFNLVYDEENYKWLKKELSFNYNHWNYELSITDPEYKKVEYNGKTFNEGAIVLSIPSEPYNEWYNKFVAKIFLI